MVHEEMATGGMHGVIQPKDVPADIIVSRNPEQLETPTVKVIADEDGERTMRAVEFHAKVQTSFFIALFHLFCRSCNEIAIYTGNFITCNDVSLWFSSS